MYPGLVVKLRPPGPWRNGPDSGARHRVDPVYHSDSLYSALTGAMRTLGRLDEWLDATARNPQGPAVRFSSCFPFQGDIGYVIPPRSIWPPLGGAPVASPKVRWKSARYIPLALVEALLAGQIPDEDKWEIDGPSECLVPAGRPGPFRIAVRSSAAVDRMGGSAERHATACIEFFPGAGLWTVVSFAGAEQSDRWNPAVRAAFRLLADSGFGGERGRGWGRSEEPEFIEGELPDMILAPPPAPSTPEPQPEPPAEAVLEGEAAVVTEPPLDAGPEPTAATAAPSEAAAASAAAVPSREREGAVSHWLLSLFTPAPDDAIDWARGNYGLITRSGRIDSPARQGDLKKQLHMIAEGSVLVAARAPQGASTDVAPDNFPHPVYRAGFALAIPLPAQVTA
jgi:CRISPR type III-A-associated RAMP protein Csm4